MGSIWPFKKKAVEAEGQKIVTYSKDDQQAEEIMADRSHIEDDQYQAALDLLTKPHLGEVPSGVVANSLDDDQQNDETLDSLETVSGDENQGEYEQSDDGYWYLKKNDGTFDLTAHIKSEDGSVTPYSE